MEHEDASTRAAASLMAGFAKRTGLDPPGRPRRYLWTDAFAVLNFLALARRTGEARWRKLALRLIHDVHVELGRHRPDAPRRGWLGGLTEEEGAKHPTRGGLRIGKPLPERGPSEPFDEALEWERDGQYFHYLTKWMYALDRASSDTGDACYRTWARELLGTAHGAFVRGSSQARRMVWKMSCDLSRPLVPFAGQHDPLEGFLACLELEDPSGSPELRTARSDFAQLLARTDLSTEDALGLGGLLADAASLAKLLERIAVEDGDILLQRLLDTAAEGLARYARRGDLVQTASRRLGFRELGLALGLLAIRPMARRLREDSRGAFRGRNLRVRIEALLPKTVLGPAIVAFWLAPENRRGSPWTDHLDIDEVMLATCLVPEGYLDLSPLEGSPAP